MKDENRLFKNVSFNRKDSFEMQLYHHAKQQGMFAKYVKRLIQRDMEQAHSSAQCAPLQPTPQPSFTPPVEQKQTPPVIVREEPKEKKVSMSSFI
ncbi:hypothetical protein MUG87_01865 [Ectobacillus sp. JY-23]|uniref:hypothetical protein n=1 Tax=Ectobacillus sp. JY-23 TaxID=2933872 RepID=UPI001FF333DD|nr:hypothetical protein [Ectobacillus sp. JY-23]UOY92917.1 hypothetical protein MUG87_01865 [Ectobacillus sp. JY-23]